MIDDTKKKAKVQDISEPADAPVTDTSIQDIDLGFVEKKKFRIGGDFNRILELNVSDLNIFSRYSKAYPQLEELLKQARTKVQELSPEDSDSDQLAKIADILDEIDAEMRKKVDYIFDTNVSEVCAPSGNMFDPVNGGFRFEHIINTLAGLYTNGLEDEIKKFKAKSSKYTKKYHK